MTQHFRPPTTSSIFFTVALAERGSDLLLREIDLLRQAVRLTRAERPFDIDAFVVLPDHLHAILTLPEGDSDHATRWRLIKTRFSAGLPKGPLTSNRLGRPEPGLWQRRYWERHLRGAEDYAAHHRFCRSDPVLHGLTDTAEDWPYSSFHRQPALLHAG